MKVNTVNLFCCCREWRTRSQLLCCSSTISILVILMIFLIEQLIFESVQTEFISSSRYLFQRQTEIQLRQFMNEQIQHTFGFFMKGAVQLTAINDIYQLVQQQNLLSNVPPYDCLGSPLQNDTYAYSSSFCYMFCNTEKQIILSDHKDILNLTALLTQYLPIFDMRRIIYYAGLDEDSFLAKNPGTNFIDFKVQERPWYKTYLNNLQKHQYTTAFSNPYFQWTNFVAIAQNANLTNLQGKLTGISGQDLQLSHIVLIDDPEQHLIIANASGCIMAGSYYIQSQSFLNIFNESVTGFKYQDWLLMKSTADENSTKILQMSNSALKTDIFVTVQRISYPEYYFIIFSQFPQITDDETIISDKLLYFQEQYNQILIVTILSLLAITILQMLLIIYTLKPVEQLGKVAEQSYSAKFDMLKQVKYLGKPKGQSGTINLLVAAYHNMTDGFTNSKKKTKNNEQTNLQNIKYPINIHQFEWDRSCFKYMNASNVKQIDVLRQLLKPLKSVYRFKQ